MKTRIGIIARGETGKILVMALVLLVLGALLLTPLLGLMSTGLTAGQVYERKTAELYAADAGVEDAINWLLHGRPQDWNWAQNPPDQVWNRGAPIEVNNRSVTVEVREIADDTYSITSTAESPEGGSTTVTSMVWAVPKHEHCYDDGLDLGQNESIKGDVFVTGDVTLEQSSSIEDGDVYIIGNLTLGQYSRITGGVICITGNIALENNTLIDADIHFLGNHCVLTIDNPQSFVRGNIWAEGNLTIVIDNGSNPAEIVGNVYAPIGNVELRLNVTKTELVGDIYAGNDINVYVGANAQNAHHTGNEYPEYTGEPPFQIDDCPDWPNQQAITYTYEIS